MAMVRKIQPRKIDGRDIQAEAACVEKLSRLLPGLPAITAVCDPLRTSQHNRRRSKPYSQPTEHYHQYKYRL